VVDTSKKFESTFVTPTFIPGVNNEPIFGSIFNTPTDDFDSMATKL
jgi:hypothetical protein